MHTKQKTVSAILLLLVTVSLFTGCNSEPPKPQAVVIDVRAIWEASGIDEQIKKRTEIIDQQIAEEIKALSAKLSKELEDEKSRYGDNPSDEDNKKIQTLREQLRRQLMQARLAGSARTAKVKSEIRRSFLEDISPVAEKVALQYGASIILKAQSAVFWSADSIDITNEVIGRLPAPKALQSPNTPAE